MSEIDIGLRFKEIRKALSLTQSEFANTLGIDHAHISKIEGSKGKASELLLKHICSEYFISRHWLDTGEGDIFIAPEEALENIMARYGERAISQAFNIIMKEHHHLADAKGRCNYHTSTGDADLDHIVNTLYELWSVGDEKLKAWASVQFDRAIPTDVVEKAQNKTAGSCP
ncbi:MAG: helix-turn-helix transcriptional regulator [Thermacetogeniaceae bacterium]